MKNEIKYSISVYEDHAIITGKLSTKALSLLVELSREEGFKYLAPNPNGKGFKLIGEDD